MTQNQVDEARQLLRLRALREDTAHAALQASRRKLADCEASVARRERRISQVRHDRSTLRAWLCGDGALQLPRVAASAGARLAALDEEIEREEHALVDERIALASAVRAETLARADWARASSRRQAVAELAADAWREHARDRERHAERELDMPRALPAH